MSLKTGLLLINLGTPDSPEPDAVARYLRQFLMDPMVIDIPFVWRWILVNLLIIPRRKYQSSEAYKKIWTNEGSPLLCNSELLLNKVKERLGEVPCVLGMRYGSPSIESALTQLKSQDVGRLLVLPLYPQYALSSTESSVLEVKRCLNSMGWEISPQYVKDFFDKDFFVSSVVEKIQSEMKPSEYDKIAFSFHGLPVRHLQKLDQSGRCYRHPNCCDRVSSENRWCYRAQCFATARKVAAKLGLGTDDYLVTFQSRLGRSEWIKPYTDQELPKLAQQGAKRIAVVCPSFVSDCLEALEEINMRARDDFMKAGGEKFTYISCVNADEQWVDGLSDFIRSLA